MVAVLVGIACHHSQGLVTAHALHGGQIDACLYQVGNGCMPEGMPDHLRDIQASPRPGKPEGLFNGYCVARFGAPGRGE